MKRLGFSLLVIAGTLVLLLGSTGSTSATPVQTPTDACGVEGFDVPDSGDSFDFTAACAAHDACYVAGGGAAARARCDNQFYREMTNWCTSRWQPGDPRLGRCKLVAATYYTAVRLGGWLYFYG